VNPLAVFKTAALNRSATLPAVEAIGEFRPITAPLPFKGQPAIKLSGRSDPVSDVFHCRGQSNGLPVLPRGADKQATAA
jgi:hypothetical protein